VQRVRWYMTMVVAGLALLAAACGVEVSVDGGGGLALPDAARSAQQVLAQRLGVQPDDVEITKVEAVEWSDSCLGIPRIDAGCALVMTPGYRVTLLAVGQEYVFHTDAEGAAVELASGPGTEVVDPMVEWMGSADGCLVAHITADEVTAGACDASLVTAPFTTADRPDELRGFAATYAPFVADTPAGAVTFRGTGTTPASPAEQRMIAEWARLVAQEAQAGRSGASWALAIAYHAEGGFLPAGSPFQCWDVAVYLTGEYVVTGCADAGPVTYGQGRLDEQRLAELYDLVDELAPFEVSADDRAADGPATTLVFTGAGTIEADDAAQDAVAELARQLGQEHIDG
jgi:hypothetical protein